MSNKQSTQRRLDVAELFALADALQMELSITQGDQIDGIATGVIDAPALGLQYPLNLEVVSSRCTWKDGKSLHQALLLRLGGSLGMCAIHDRQSSTVHVAMLDVRRLGPQDKPIKLDGFFEERKDVGLGNLLTGFIQKAVVASFWRGDYAAAWGDRSPIFQPPPQEQVQGQAAQA